MFSFRCFSSTGPAAFAVRGDIENWLENIPALDSAESLELDSMIPVGSFQLGIAHNDICGSFPSCNSLYFHEGAFCTALISHFLGGALSSAALRRELPVGAVNSYSS